MLFTLNHMRAAIHSKYLANINKFAGHQIKIVAHIADWGLDMAALIVGYRQFGIENELLQNPTLHLSEVMKATLLHYETDVGFRDKVKQCFEEMLNEDTKVLSEWHLLRNLSLKQHESLFKRIGIHFDEMHFDSSYYKEIKKICDHLVEAKIVTLESNGTIKIEILENNKAEIIYNDFMGSALYEIGRNLLAFIQRKAKYNFDLYYIVSPQKNTNFSTLFNLIKTMEYDWHSNLHHLELSNINLPNLKKGKSLPAEEILTKSKIFMLGKLKNDLGLDNNLILEDIAEILGKSSLFINDMKHKRNYDYLFNFEDVLSFGKDGGISYQLLHAGLKGIQVDKMPFKDDADTSPLNEKEAHNLIRHLARFDEMVYKSYCKCEPYILYQYLSSLWYFADKASDVLKLDVKDDKTRVIKARLLLLTATQKVLHKGLELLGVEPLDDMIQ